MIRFLNDNLVKMGEIGDATIEHLQGHNPSKSIPSFSAGESELKPKSSSTKAIPGAEQLQREFRRLKLSYETVKCAGLQSHHSYFNPFQSWPGHEHVQTANQKAENNLQYATIFILIVLTPVKDSSNNFPSSATIMWGEKKSIFLQRENMR